MENTDSKFVKGLFSLLSWIFSTGPLLYAIWVHDWLLLGLVLIAEIGVALGIAIKNHGK